MKRRAVILGSGVCGLAIALRIHEIDPEIDVLLLEEQERVGGLARSLTIRGQVADMGPHRIHTELPDVQAFLRDIAGEQMVQVQRRSQMWLHGRWIDYPPRPMEMLRVWGPGRLAKATMTYAAESLARALRRPSRRESYESVMRHAFGSELYRLIVLDYTRKVWKIDPRQLHADIARVRVSAGGLDRLIKRVFVPEQKGRETALRQFYYIPGGVERLVERMRQRVEVAGASILTKRRVVDLEPGDAGWRVTSQDEHGVRHVDQADLVFSTIPVTELLDILLARRPEERIAAAKDSMRFIANFLVLVVVNRPHVTQNQWLYFPGGDTIFNRGYEPKNFSPEMGTEDQALLVLEITCHHGDAIWRTDDEELIERTLDGLERTKLVGRSEVAAALVHRIPNTYPLYDLQYRRRLAGVWRYLAGFPGLLSVGRQGLFLHNNMDHSIHMGFRAAAVALAEHPEEPERHFYREVRRFQKFRIVD